MSVRSMFICLILTFCVCLLVCGTPLQAAQQGPTPQLESLFLGPKAETGDFLRDLLQSIVNEQSAWRQGFHPEDRPSISPQTLAAPEAAATRTSLKQQLSAHAALPILSGKKTPTVLVLRSTMMNPFLADEQAFGIYFNIMIDALRKAIDTVEK